MENISAGSLEFLEACFDRYMQLFVAVSRIVDLDWISRVLMLVTGGVLGGNKKLISNAVLLRSFAYESLRGLVLSSVQYVALHQHRYLSSQTLGSVFRTYTDSFQGLTAQTLQPLVAYTKRHGLQRWCKKYDNGPIS